jgi:protein phosphatase
MPPPDATSLNLPGGAFEIGSALDPGRKRGAGKNQDALCVLGVPGPLPPLLVVADGMGGVAGGAEASQAVIASLAGAYTRAAAGALPLADPLALLRAGVADALAALRSAAGERPELARMGSTVVAALLEPARVALTNVGDSRAYLVGQSGIRQISFDHTLVGEGMRKGYLSREDARRHPQRSVLSLCVSAQRERVDPFTGLFPWAPGDCLVLCSDGLWGPVSEARIHETVMVHPPEQAAQRLVTLANENFGPDNIAVIVARCVK